MRSTKMVKKTFPNENPKFVGFVVYKQGDNGTLFYIIFTGSVKSSVWTQGVQDDVVTIIQAGKWFGDRVLETDNLLRSMKGINHLRS
ncbi:unnamed protein product [Sphagnum troendelagicum]|uniref:Cyclic nucleotide-binding domain-containing protein n=1 Tax=Sphagnum jensenii TaxID=128206 RepID=A0ABP0WR94_9BRYO